MSRKDDIILFDIPVLLEAMRKISNTGGIPVDFVSYFLFLNLFLKLLTLAVKSNGRIAKHHIFA